MSQSLVAMAMLLAIYLILGLLHHVSLEMRMRSVEDSQQRLWEQFGRLRSVWWEGVGSRYPHSEIDLEHDPRADVAFRKDFQNG